MSMSFSGVSQAPRVPTYKKSNIKPIKKKVQRNVEISSAPVASRGKRAFAASVSTGEAETRSEKKPRINVTQSMAGQENNDVTPIYENIISNIVEEMKGFSGKVAGYFAEKVDLDLANKYGLELVIRANLDKLVSQLLREIFSNYDIQDQHVFSRQLLKDFQFQDQYDIFYRNIYRFITSEEPKSISKMDFLIDANVFRV